MNRHIVFRIIGALLLIALLVAGGTFVYQAGVTQGISQAPEVAQAIQQSAEDGNPNPMFNRGYGYGYPFHHGFGFGPHFGFLPFGFCFSILLVFFFFGMLRFIFRPWAWHKHGHGHWGKHWEGGVPPKFDEWHKRAHGEESKEVDK
jgi:hypothetical protein